MLKFEGIQLHAQNLFPGIIITSELLFLLDVDLNSLQNEFFKTIFLLVLSYVLGLISSIVSRLVIDLISENYARWIFLEYIAHIHLEEAAKEYNIKTKISVSDEKEGRVKDFWEIIRIRRNKKKRNKITKWNMVYRSALRQAKDDKEVNNRRAEGRLVRNLFIPIFLGGLIVPKLYNYQINLWLISLTFFCSMIFTVFLYGYAELRNFAEAHDIARKREDKTLPN